MAKIGVLFGIAALMSVGIAQADPGGWGGERCGKQQRHHSKEMAQKLGLTDAQKAQAKAIFQGNREVVKPIVTSLRVEQKSLQALIHADTLDEAAIRAETAKIAGIQADLNVNRAKVAAQFRAILTPSQVAILKTLPQNCQEKGAAPPEPTE
jgi:Spy/CpxP family protein refolding chaperone